MKSHFFILKVVLFVFLISPFSLAQVVITEVLNLRLENENLLIDVAKRYPDIEFLTINESNQIKIKLKNTKYHTLFPHDTFDKTLILNESNILKDIEISDFYETEGNLVITLTLINNKFFIPKIKSTVGNVVAISFLPKVKKQEDVSLSKEDITNLYNLAVEKQISGSYEEAEKLYNEVILHDPMFYFARFNLAKIYLDKQFFEKAINILEILINDLTQKTYDKKVLLLFQNTLGTIYLLTDSLDKAKEQYEKVLKLDPSFYQAYFNIALINEKLIDIKKAKDFLKKVIEVKPDYAEAYYHFAVISLINNDKRQAIINFKKVIELVPDAQIAKLSKLELEKIDKK